MQLDWGCGTGTAWRQTVRRDADASSGVGMVVRNAEVTVFAPDWAPGVLEDECAIELGDEEDEMRGGGREGAGGARDHAGDIVLQDRWVDENGDGGAREGARQSEVAECKARIDRAAGECRT